MVNCTFEEVAEHIFKLKYEKSAKQKGTWLFLECACMVKLFVHVILVYLCRKDSFQETCEINSDSNADSDHTQHWGTQRSSYCI